MRSLRELPDWEIVLLRTKPLSARPAIPLGLRERVRVRSGRVASVRAELLSEAAIFAPAPTGSPPPARGRCGGGGRGGSPGVAEQPELAAAAIARLAESPDLRRRKADAARSEVRDFGDVAGELNALYTSLGTRRRTSRREQGPLADRPWIVADLHMHTSWSHDCSIEVDELLDHAAAEGLGAIAVTDHNVFGGALEAVERACNRELIVIPARRSRRTARAR